MRFLTRFRDRATAGCAVALLLAGCNSERAATPANLMRGLNQYLAGHDECLYPGGLRLPYETGSKEATPALDALATAGLLNRTEEKSIGVKRFALTPFAMSHVTPQFCYGHREATSVESFSSPVVVNGQQTTHVVYHYKMVDVPGWGQSDAMRSAFPGLAAATTGQPEGTATMVLTMGGWEVLD